MAVVAITKERQGGETRVAATPDSVRKLIAMGLKVRVESGAGDGASIPDAEYAAAGATVTKGAAATVKDADLLFKVRAPDAAEIAALKKGAVVSALLYPHLDRKSLDALA